jgi:diphthamide synthase subunit DPH2
MSADDKDQITLYVRVRPEMAEALDALAERLGKDVMAFPMGKPSRADIMRMALVEGMRIINAKIKGE